MRHALFVFLGLISLWAACGLCPAISVSTSPFPKTVLSGQAAPIAINLDTATQFRGCMIRIAYDTDLLSYVSTSRGPLWTGYNIGWWRTFNGAPNETPGVLRIECVIFGAGYFATGPGNLFNINFNTLTEGYSELNILEVKLYEPVNGTLIPGVTGTSGAVIIGPNPAYAYAKCYLQGPYQDALMSTELNSRLPLISPYPVDPVAVDSIPPNVVDWVLVELRQSLSGPALKSQAMWLYSDGSVKSPGKAFMLFMNTTPQAWYVVIKHRNHLSLKSSSPLNLTSSGSPSLLDLRLSSNVHPDGSTIQIGDYCALKAGDANQDGVINAMDRNNFWRLQVGTKGYLAADFDLDGKVLPSDLNLMWRTNSREISTDPEDRGGIEFSLTNAALEEIGTQTYLTFNIQASAALESSLLGTGIVLINYDSTVFGENVCTSGAVSVQAGSQISATFPIYQLIINDYEPGCLAITFEFTGNQNAGSELPIIAGELLQIRLRIANLNHYAGLGWLSQDMQNQQFQSDNYSLLDPVYTLETAEIYLPARPQGLSLQIIGSNLQLSWQAISGCSYTVYSTDDPFGNDWQIEASALNQTTWTQNLNSARHFYRVRSRAIQTENLQGGRF